jgi:hypothetical protein
VLGVLAPDVEEAPEPAVVPALAAAAGALLGVDVG